ncbi:MAG TPA: triple tyrosine motif-containing protein, partial [Bacteroidia bacterium]
DKLDYKSKKIISYKFEKAKNSISDNTVNCIFDDRKGNLWLGTSSGLNKFNIETQNFTHYFEKDGISNSSIWAILGDKRGDLWISTNKGLSRFNPSVDNKDGSAFKNFTTHDGLQGDEFAQGSYFLNQKTGEMFFGGLNGFNSFFPDNILDNKHIPSVHITSFKKLGKEAEPDTSIAYKKHLTLSYKDNFISFEFVALDYIFPEKNKYSFKMEGLDNDWSPPSTRRYVSYTNLPGGDYTFRIKASNSDDIWNEDGVSIHLTVIPPWWKTNTFYAFSVLFSIAFVFGFIRFRTAAIEKEKKILEQKVEERTAELAQKNKDITSSIQYAKRIQDAILPTKDLIKKHFPDSFVLFNPKDIVSGDFYWFGEKNGKKIAACVDCTGHGVPGAFMSMIGTNLLNQIILENGITEPAAILSALNQGVRTALKQGTHSDIETTDGMDIALCSINVTTREVQFSSAQRHLVIISKGNLEKIDGNKFPIGGAQVETERVFTNHLKFLQPGDMLYMFSDGYADQFGGEKGKKFMIKRLHAALGEINMLPVLEQKELLNNRIEDWKGNHSQVDDILVIGIRL